MQTNNSSEYLPYEFSYDHGQSWRPMSRTDTVRLLYSYYTTPEEIVLELDKGEVLACKSLRVRRANMQAD